MSNVPVVLLVGCPGAGKTTYAGREFADATVIHSDDYKSNERQILKAMATAMDEFPARLLVLDGCHCTAKKRQVFVQAAAKAGRPVEARVVHTPFETCMARAAARAASGGRKVPKVALYTFRKQFAMPSTSEGFARVVVHKV